MSSDRIITPTGRLVFEDKLKGSAEEFQHKMQEAMDRFKSHEDGEGRRYFVLTGDYSQLELYVLAAMMHESKSGVVLDFEGSGSMPGFLDEMTIFRQSGGQIAEAIQPKQPATKQNGRSAAYLAHDPSKRHRGPRRGR